jgi:hypothetical protein
MQESFPSTYQQLEDNELLEIVREKNQLLPEAKVALEKELKRRRLESPRPRIWLREAGSNETVHCLNDYVGYQELCARRAFLRRYRYALTLGPFLLLLVLGGRRFENSIPAFGAIAAWWFSVIAYELVNFLRWCGFKCPQCHHVFGRDSECIACGFARE